MERAEPIPFSSNLLQRMELLTGGASRAHTGDGVAGDDDLEAVSDACQEAAEGHEEVEAAEEEA